MSGTEVYHSVPQSSRIQKRLVLNQCFKTAREIVGRGEQLTYVTYGGEELHDVMDFLAVFDVRQHQLRVVSYEQDAAAAERSSQCPVASTLSQIDTIRVQIVPTAFFDQPAPLIEARPEGRFIYFLDDTKPFTSVQSSRTGEPVATSSSKRRRYLINHVVCYA